MPEQTDKRAEALTTDTPLNSLIYYAIEELMKSTQSLNTAGVVRIALTTGIKTVPMAALNGMTFLGSTAWGHLKRLRGGGGGGGSAEDGPEPSKKPNNKNSEAQWALKILVHTINQIGLQKHDLATAMERSKIISNLLLNLLEQGTSGYFTNFEFNPSVTPFTVIDDINNWMQHPPKKIHTIWHTTLRTLLFQASQPNGQNDLHTLLLEIETILNAEDTPDQVDMTWVLMQAIGQQPQVIKSIVLHTVQTLAMQDPRAINTALRTPPISKVIPQIYAPIIAEIVQSFRSERALLEMLVDQIPQLVDAMQTDVELEVTLLDCLHNSIKDQPGSGIVASILNITHLPYLLGTAAKQALMLAEQPQEENDLAIDKRLQAKALLDLPVIADQMTHCITLHTQQPFDQKQGKKAIVALQNTLRRELKCKREQVALADQINDLLDAIKARIISQIPVMQDNIDNLRTNLQNQAALYPYLKIKAQELKTQLNTLNTSNTTDTPILTEALKHDLLTLITPILGAPNWQPDEPNIDDMHIIQALDALILTNLEVPSPVAKSPDGARSIKKQCQQFEDALKAHAQLQQRCNALNVHVQGIVKTFQASKIGTSLETILADRALVNDVKYLFELEQALVGYNEYISQQQYIKNKITTLQKALQQSDCGPIQRKLLGRALAGTPLSFHERKQLGKENQKHLQQWQHLKALSQTIEPYEHPKQELLQNIVTRLKDEHSENVVEIITGLADTAHIGLQGLNEQWIMALSGAKHLPLYWLNPIRSGLNLLTQQKVLLHDIIAHVPSVVALIQQKKEVTPSQWAKLAFQIAQTGKVINPILSMEGAAEVLSDALSWVIIPAKSFDEAEQKEALVNQGILDEAEQKAQLAIEKDKHDQGQEKFEEQRNQLRQTLNDAIITLQDSSFGVHIEHILQNETLLKEGALLLRLQEELKECPDDQSAHDYLITLEDAAEEHTEQIAKLRELLSVIEPYEHPKQELLQNIVTRLKDEHSENVVEIITGLADTAHIGLQGLNEQWIMALSGAKHLPLYWLNPIRSGLNLLTQQKVLLHDIIAHVPSVVALIQQKKEVTPSQWANLALQIAQTGKVINPILSMEGAAGVLSDALSWVIIPAKSFDEAEQKEALVNQGILDEAAQKAQLAIEKDKHDRGQEKLEEQRNQLRQTLNDAITTLQDSSFGVHIEHILQNETLLKEGALLLRLQEELKGYPDDQSAHDYLITLEDAVEEYTKEIDQLKGALQAIEPNEQEDQSIHDYLKERLTTLEDAAKKHTKEIDQLKEALQAIEPKEQEDQSVHDYLKKRLTTSENAVEEHTKQIARLGELLPAIEAKEQEGCPEYQSAHDYLKELLTTSEDAVEEHTEQIAKLRELLADIEPYEHPKQELLQSIVTRLKDQHSENVVEIITGLLETAHKLVNLDPKVIATLAQQNALPIQWLPPIKEIIAVLKDESDWWASLIGYAPKLTTLVNSETPGLDGITLLQNLASTPTQSSSVGNETEDVITHLLLHPKLAKIADTIYKATWKEPHLDRQKALIHDVEQYLDQSQPHQALRAMLEKQDVWGSDALQEATKNCMRPNEKSEALERLLSYNHAMALDIQHPNMLERRVQSIEIMRQGLKNSHADRAFLSLLEQPDQWGSMAWIMQLQRRLEHTETGELKTVLQQCLQDSYILRAQQTERAQTRRKRDTIQQMVIQGIKTLQTSNVTVIPHILADKTLASYASLAWALNKQTDEVEARNLVTLGAKGASHLIKTHGHDLNSLLSGMASFLAQHVCQSSVEQKRMTQTFNQLVDILLYQNRSGLTLINLLTDKVLPTILLKEKQLEQQKKRDQQKEGGQQEKQYTVSTFEIIIETTRTLQSHLAFRSWRHLVSIPNLLARLIKTMDGKTASATIGHILGYSSVAIKQLEKRLVLLKKEVNKIPVSMLSILFFFILVLLPRTRNQTGYIIGLVVAALILVPIIIVLCIAALLIQCISGFTSFTNWNKIGQNKSIDSAESIEKLLADQDVVNMLGGTHQAGALIKHIDSNHPLALQNIGHDISQAASTKLCSQPRQRRHVAHAMEQLFKGVINTQQNHHGWVKGIVYRCVQGFHAHQKAQGEKVEHRIDETQLIVESSIGHGLRNPDNGRAWLHAYLQNKHWGQLLKQASFSIEVIRNIDADKACNMIERTTNRSFDATRMSLAQQELRKLPKPVASVILSVIMLLATRKRPMWHAMGLCLLALITAPIVIIAAIITLLMQCFTGFSRPSAWRHALYGHSTVTQYTAKRANTLKPEPMAIQPTNRTGDTLEQKVHENKP